MDTREGIAEMNLPMSSTSWGRSGSLPSRRFTPGSRRTRRRASWTPAAAGWSSIAIAKAYPNAVVHGFDADEASIATARANAERPGCRTASPSPSATPPAPASPAATTW